MSVIQFFLSSGPHVGVPPLPEQPEVSYSDLDKTREFLADLLARRGSELGNGQSLRMTLESIGATLIPVTAFEPDPATCRSKYYYNAADNILYQRSFVANKPNKGKVIAIWKRIS